MERVVIFWVELIAVSALLYLLHRALFRGKASYFAQRALLLSIPVMALLSAFASFELIELRGVGGEILEEIVLDDQTYGTYRASQESISPEGFRVVRSRDNHLGVVDLALYFWGVVSFVLLLIFVWQLSKIISLRKVAARERRYDYSIYRLWGGEGAFSFWRGIYIGQELEGARLDLILRHEVEHIRRCHYLDKLVAEIYMILLWFNPIVRIIQRELSLIHEYEADHAVVEGGCDVRSYKMFIFEEITTHVPTFANGISGSQIKKRFITMDRQPRVSHRALRALVTIVTFSTIAATSMVYVEAKETPSMEIAVESPLKVSIMKLEDKEKRTPGVDARADQIYITENIKHNRNIYVTRCEDHTKVYVGAEIIWGRHWFVLSEETYLIDPASGDKYMLHSSGSGLPLETVVSVVGQEGQYVYFELIFPPLDEGVERVELKEWAKAATTEGWGRSRNTDHIGWHFTNVKVEEELPYFVSRSHQPQS